ncbi:unnamed protein product [Oppiella nova]|uniref:Uncharacterized protein n=1 Tax=Oppiella nova TaxID=334625 RepID=A0A7R9Q9S7_9ACAR|nr:unnamed protein product [Oppiella nova]CAG2161490.1 unnamed protein product [Oppiella nova]
MSSKRHRDDEEEDGDNGKRVCRSHAYDSHSVSLRWPFNQLMKVRPNKVMSRSVDICEKCCSCVAVMTISDGTQLCHFCERRVLNNLFTPSPVNK